MAATAGKILVDGDGIQRRGCVGDEGNDPKTRVTAAATGCGNVTFEELFNVWAADVYIPVCCRWL